MLGSSAVGSRSLVNAQHMGVTLELPSSSVFFLHPPAVLEKKPYVRWKSFFAGFSQQNFFPESYYGTGLTQIGENTALLRESWSVV